MLIGLHILQYYCVVCTHSDIIVIITTRNFVIHVPSPLDKYCDRVVMVSVRLTVCVRVSWILAALWSLVA